MSREAKRDAVVEAVREDLLMRSKLIRPIVPVCVEAWEAGR